MASFDVKPKIRTAPGFQKLIMPPASVAMIASEAVPKTASTRPDGKLAVSLYLDPASCALCKSQDTLSVR